MCEVLKFVASTLFFQSVVGKQRKLGFARVFSNELNRQQKGRVHCEEEFIYCYISMHLFFCVLIFYVSIF